MSTSSNALRLIVSDSSVRFLHPGSETRFSVDATQSPALLGRIPTAAVYVRSDNVSRQHAQLQFDGKLWRISDVGSKAGTRVNQTPLRREEWYPLRGGDEIQVGPVKLLVAGGNASDDSQRLLTVAGASDRSSIVARDINGQVSAIPEQELSGLAQQRLNVLLRSAGRLSMAEDVPGLATAIAESASEGTGSPRAILIGADGEDDWRILGCYPREAGPGPEITISRSLVNLARNGRVAQLQPDDSGSAFEMQSIVSLNIHSALCVPMSEDQRVVAVLYLDTRGNERPIERDAAAFCVGLAQLGGMAWANLKRAELARQEKALRDELNEARAAQQMMLPAAEGVVGPLRYALQSTPGTIVAGDLFDVMPVGERHTLVLLGDVMGKGAPAGLMMAAVQTYFRAIDHQQLDLSRWVQAANLYFCERFGGKGFVTLWLGAFEQGTRRVAYVDAGHGHWCLIATDGTVEGVESSGGPPLGLMPDATYSSGELQLLPGQRIVLYSDGLVEQQSPTGELFGEKRAWAGIARSRTPAEDVQLLAQAHAEFRGTAALSDDLTLASLTFEP